MKMCLLVISCDISEKCYASTHKVIQITRLKRPTYECSTFSEISIANCRSIWRYRSENFDIYKMYTKKFALCRDRVVDYFAFLFFSRRHNPLWVCIHSPLAGF